MPRFSLVRDMTRPCPRPPLSIRGGLKTSTCTAPATLAYRKAWREELRRHDGNYKLANPHVSLDAAGVAVQELARR